MFTNDERKEALEDYSKALADFDRVMSEIDSKYGTFARVTVTEQDASGFGDVFIYRLRRVKIDAIEMRVHA